MDKTPYTGWLTSPDIVKRSFAVLGHFFLAYLMVAVSLGVVFFIGAVLEAL